MRETRGQLESRVRRELQGLRAQLELLVLLALRESLAWTGWTERLERRALPVRQELRALWAVRAIRELQALRVLPAPRALTAWRATRATRGTQDLPERRVLPASVIPEYRVQRERRD